MTDATKHIAVLDHILNGTGELPKMEDSERAIKAAIAALAMQVIDENRPPLTDTRNCDCTTAMERAALKELLDASEELAACDAPHETNAKLRYKQAYAAAKVVSSKHEPKFMHMAPAVNLPNLSSINDVECVAGYVVGMP